MSILKKQKNSSMSIKPIKLKFENIREKAEEKGKQLSNANSISKQEDALNQLYRSVQNQIVSKMIINEQVLQKCEDLMKIIDEVLDKNLNSTSSRFRIKNTRTKVGGIQMMKDESFSEFKPETSPTFQNTYNSETDHDIENIPLIRDRGSYNENSNSALFRKTKLRAISGKTIAKGVSNTTNLQKGGALKIIDENRSTGPVDMEDSIKKMKLLMEQLTDQRDSKTRQLEQCEKKLQQMTAQLKQLISSKDALHKMIEEKDEEVEINKTCCRLLDAELEKIRLKAEEQKNIEFELNLHFQLKVLDTTQIPTILSAPEIIKKQEKVGSEKIADRKQKWKEYQEEEEVQDNQIYRNNQNQGNEIEQEKTKKREKLLEQYQNEVMNHLKMIVVSQNEEIDSLKNRFMKISYQ